MPVSKLDPSPVLTITTPHTRAQLFSISYLQEQLQRSDFFYSQRSHLIYRCALLGRVWAWSPACAVSRVAMAADMNKDSRKRKVGDDFPPPAEDDEEVIGPMPAAPDRGIKRKKGAC